MGALSDLDDLAALRLQLEWGVDEALGDLPLDRFTAVPPARPTLVPAPLPAALPALAPVSQPAPLARTLDDLVAELAAFQGCALRTTATQLVRPDGNPQAKLVIIGDAPGSDDDRSGRAFSGPAGQLLDRVLMPMGLGREHALLTMLVPWRPPGNRRLSEAEVQACLPFLHRLLGIVRPACLMLLGLQATRALAGETGSLRRARGRMLNVQVHNEQLAIAAMAFPAPEQWLSNAATKQALWTDLIALRRAVTTG